MEDRKFIEVTNLKKYFVARKSLLHQKTEYVKAVDDISFNINRGETFGLVGESGCGKSTVARTIIRLYDPTSGSIKMDGVEIGTLSRKNLKPYRQKIQMIFQDPYASLDPRMTIKQIIEEPLDTHRICEKSQHIERIVNVLELVGMGAHHLERYPHEFSGGQRQRIGIARSLIAEPEFVICDEPISALDVSIQAQVVNMLQDLQEKMGLTYLFIAHDLAMVKYISKRMGVMYLGQLVELAPSNKLYKNPLHPYTQGLLSSIPVPDPRRSANKAEVYLDGEIPSPLNPPSGCRFRTRCKYSKKMCAEISPSLKQVDLEHYVSCHLFE